MPPPDSNRSGGNFFAWRDTARRCQFFWKASEIWKPGSEADAGHVIIRRAVKIDDFLRRHLCVLRNMIKIESELRIVTNRDLDYARDCALASLALAMRELLMNFLC